MSVWFLDASVLLARADVRDKHHAAAVRLLDSNDVMGTLDLAFYEVTNIAIRMWRDPVAAERLCERVAAIAAEGGLVRADATLLESAAAIAEEYGISAYDAAYVAAARRAGAKLVSCDERDLVSRGLARLPTGG